MTFTTDDIITLAAVVAAVGALYAIIAQPFKLLRHINHVTTFTAYEVQLQSDMISTLFDHAISPKSVDELTEIKKKYEQEYTLEIFEKRLSNILHTLTES